MFRLPLAITSCFLILISIVVGERTIVIFSAIILFTLGLLTTSILSFRYRSHSGRKFSFLLVALCLVTFVSVPITNWPLRAAFKLCHSSFDKIASSLQAGKTFPNPIQIGFFSIKKAEICTLNGKICLWTNLDPAGKTGFTKCPINNVPFNLWSIIKLDNDWQFISED